jgi:hypothetical protein
MGAQIEYKQKKIKLSTSVDNKIYTENMGNVGSGFIIVVFN